MDISIRNFRNIQELDFKIEKNKLSLIHAHNGTGKSSISMALKSDPLNLDEHRSFYDWGDPSVIKDAKYNYITFDENFINFQEFGTETPLDNSYELIFKDSRILDLESKIQTEKTHLVDILDTSDYKQFKNEVEILNKGLQFNKSMGLKNTVHLKAINSKLPDSLIKKNTNMRHIFDNQFDQVAYTSWKIKGKEYEYKTLCPYCSQDMNRGIIDLKNEFSDNVDKNHIKNKIQILNTFMSISEKVIFRSNKINLIISGKYKLESKTNKEILNSAIKKLVSLRKTILQIDNLEFMKHNNEYRQIDFDRRIFKPTNLFSLKLLNLMDDFNKKVKKLNALRKAIVKKIEKKIIEKNNDINAIFKSGGVNYTLKFVVDDLQNVRTVLQHSSSATNITNPDSTLSFGEKNLISVILFCLLLKSDSGNVLIFDDPSTLFDTTKRHLFLHLLLTRNNFKVLNKNDYVILLTHDFETFKDFAVMKQERKYFNKMDFSILNNIDGICTMKSLKTSDFEYYIDNISQCIKRTNISIVKLVYFRKLIYVGHISDKSNKMYNFISSITKYKVPQTKNGDRIYSGDEIEDIISTIANQKYIHIHELVSYVDLIESMQIDKVMKLIKGNLSWYEKLVLFRLIGFYLTKSNISIETIDPIIMKFVTQSFHVEDDHLYDLRYVEGNPVPKYVFNLIDEILVEIDLGLSKLGIIENNEEEN